MNKICRICLEEGVLSSIFTRNFNLSLSDMIEHCSNIKISKNDGLPEQLCSNCIYKLGVAYHFKQTCESADARLRHYLGLNMPCKNVDVAMMTDPITISTQVSTFRKCICKQSQQKRTSTNYKRKPENEKLKRGPKPKAKQIHSCYQCDKEFKCQAQLEMHVRTHTGDKPYVCMYCPRRFTQKHNLTIHLRIHTGEKPFQCEVCSKRFCAQGNLQTHLKIHTGQRDHLCALCNKRFITSSELTRHMCKHRGVKDHKCDICGSAFVQSRDLKIHKQTKHQILPTKTVVPRTVTVDTAKNQNDDDDIEVVSKIPPLPVKAEPLLLHNLANISTNAVQPTSITQVDRERPMEGSKEMKQMFNPYTLENQNVSCSLCGEVFDYLSLLAQHYSQKHKGYQPMQS